MRNIPTVLRSEEIIEKAFRKARRRKRSGSRVHDAERKIDSVISTVDRTLDRYIRAFPSFDRLHPFYREIYDIMFELNRAKRSLGALQWARNALKSIRSSAIKELKTTQERNADQVRRMVYGRVRSVLNRISDDLVFLDEIRREILQAPSIDHNVPVIVICGYPNVGKSTIIRRISTAKPEIAIYPFTTKGVLIGHMSHRGERYQVIDTPGLLDRPLEERNQIEMQALVALRHLASCALYVFDPAEHCGYMWEDQRNLYQSLLAFFNFPILALENKADLPSFRSRLKGALQFSALTADSKDVERLKDALADLILSRFSPSQEQASI